MIVCERCLDHKYSKISVIFEKEETSKGKERRRRMLNVGMELCESCITEFLKEFGRFKKSFCEVDEKGEK